MVHSIITEVKCRCGAPAVGSFELVRKEIYNEYISFIDFSWEPVCEYHLKRAKQEGCEVKYKQ